MEENKNCFNCENYELCFLRHKIDGALEYNNILNINDSNYSGKFTDIFNAIGNCCLKYKHK